MQTAVQVFCTPGPSLRAVIARQDPKLQAEGFHIVVEKCSGRSPGWMKIRSTAPGVWGALNISWDAATHTLICRVVNRRYGTPNQITGRFVDVLLKHYSKRIRLINIFQV